MRIASVASATACLLSCTFLLPGCGSKDKDAGAGGTGDDTELATDSNELSSESSRASGMGNVVFQPVNEASSGDAAKAASAVASSPAWYPAGCVSKTLSGNVVTIQFNGCTGPFGIYKLTGGMTATFSMNGTKLHASIADDGKLVGSNTKTGNAAPITYKAEADIVVKGNTRTVAWTANWSATTSKGNTVTHASNYTVVVDVTNTDAPCVTIDGTASGTVASRQLSTKVENFATCAYKCPSSGTITTTAAATGKSVKVVFDGSATAQVTGPGGKTFSVPLVCATEK